MYMILLNCYTCTLYCSDIRNSLHIQEEDGANWAAAHLDIRTAFTDLIKSDVMWRNTVYNLQQQP